MDSSDSSSEIPEDASAFNSYDGRFDMAKKSSSMNIKLPVVNT